MAYKITVLKLDITKAPKGYSVAEVAYKTADGKTKGMKVLDFVQKDVFATLKTVKAGDVLEANFEQNAKGFWQFKDVVLTSEKGDTSVPAASPVKSGGNWETSDERAKRQVMIVRQSSLSNAIGYLALTGDKKVVPGDVIDIAEQFEAYVLSGTPAGDKPTGEVE